LIRLISLAFAAFFMVLMASILGMMVTLFDAVEWQPFFVKSAIGAFAMLIVLGAVEAIGAREKS